MVAYLMRITNNTRATSVLLLGKDGPLKGARACRLLRMRVRL
jgi:hypothetical protein